MYNKIFAITALVSVSYANTAGQDEWECDDSSEQDLDPIHPDCCRLYSDKCGAGWEQEYCYDYNQSVFNTQFQQTGFELEIMEYESIRCGSNVRATLCQDIIKFYDPDSFYDEKWEMKPSYEWERINVFCREGEEHQEFKIAQKGGFDNNIYENDPMDSRMEFSGLFLYTNEEDSSDIPSDVPDPNLNSAVLHQTHDCSKPSWSYTQELTGVNHASTDVIQYSGVFRSVKLPAQSSIVFYDDYELLGNTLEFSNDSDESDCIRLGGLSEWKPASAEVYFNESD